MARWIRGVNLTGDYGPTVNVASFEYLAFGARDLGGLGSFTPCLLNDVPGGDWSRAYAE